MKKTVSFLILSVFAVSAAMAAGEAEFGRGLAVLKAELAAGAPDLKLPEPELKAVIVREGTRQYVRVSGYVSLSGSAWMQQDGGYTSFNFSGYTTVRDSSGRVTSNSVRVSSYEGLWLRPGQYIHHSVRPNMSVSLYKDGKYVGSTTVSGYISVSGWPSSNYVTLNGSGYLEGSLYITE
ncbi:MAG: hypothetical protein FD189_430 [Elusimicrobia bacterium]|nr:MAG: hypothetical protein FD154_535 [Elusimicrobiota bacterium]KAF0157655.1 MAG: hypothetical protein FD189_430 [Elusimicrobiota bacterium]